MNDFIFKFANFYVNFSPNLKSSLVIILFLMVLSIILGSKVKKLQPTDVPKGFLLAVVIFVDLINQFTKGFFNSKWKVFAPYLLTILLFVGFSNISSLFGLYAPFANLSIALSFSLLTFIIIQVAGFRYNGFGNRIKGLMGPSIWLSWFMFPLNVIGEISTPFAMGMRLFGNLISGAVIATIIYSFFSWYESIIAGFLIIHPIFDFGFGLIQAFVFFMLSTIFISLAVEE